MCDGLTSLGADTGDLPRPGGANLHYLQVTQIII